MSKKKAVIKILNEVDAVLFGLHRDDSNYLYEMFGIYTKGYRFSPKYKLGVWDGKIRFYSNANKTYVQLLPEIVRYLTKQGYNISLNDRRVYTDTSVPEIGADYLSDNGITLEEHQITAVNSLTQAGGGIFVGGTGAGKTICCAALAKLYHEECGFRTLIIVPKTDLISQTFDEISPFIDTGEYSGNKKDLDHATVVSTWQSLQNNKSILRQFHVILVDECHGVKGQVLKEMLNEEGSGASVRLGVTGTLPEFDDDRMNVRVALGDVVYTAPAHTLIKLGWLAKLNLTVMQLDENLHAEYEEYLLEPLQENEKLLTYAGFKRTYIKDYVAEKKYLQSLPKRNEYIAMFIEELRSQEKGNTFILVNGVPYGKKLSKLIPNSHFIHGVDKSVVRKEMYDLYTTGDDVVGICTANLASTGLNIKRIFNLVLIDPNKSFIEVIQSIGRGLRKAHDKDEVFVYDISSDLKYGKQHMSKRKKHYKSQSYDYKSITVNYDDIIGDDE